METQQTLLGKLLQSTTARMMMIGILTLVLFIPLAMVTELIAERSQRQDEVVAEIASKWGDSVYFYGPMIKVPYRTYEESVSVIAGAKQQVTQRRGTIAYAYFFPDQLRCDAKVSTKVRKRSNYEAVVFGTTLNLSGTYNMPDFSSRDIAASDVLWDKASIVINTSNLKSIKSQPVMTINGIAMPLEPVLSASRDSVQTLETAALPKGVLSASMTFSGRVAYDGSRQIMMVPIGKTTQVKMTSNWASPKFVGQYLPADNRIVNQDGFTAEWQVLHINRAFAQQFFGALPDLGEYAFGVDFIIPVNQYLQSERAAKYGFLVIGLTFLIFFLIQAMSKIRIHIFQYTMIGLALVMFYTLLISITEHSSFTLAYTIASVAVVSLIGLYSVSIMKDRRFPALIAASLTGLYVFIYVIIQMEDYALLMGSIGLFGILAAVMYVSRKIDWQ